MASSSNSTPLLYSCIAYHTTILTEHTTSASSQTSSLASIILPKIEHKSPQKLTYTHNANYIHYIASAPSEFTSSSSSTDPNPSAGGLTYIVIAPVSFGRRIPFTYLLELKSRFLSKYASSPPQTHFDSQPAYGCGDFNRTLKDLMIDFGIRGSDAIGNTQAEIENVRGIMTENIERVLERGERIDLLVDKTDRLGAGAQDFRVRSRGLKRQMWWKNVKLMVLIGVVVVFIIVFIVLITKGGSS